ncbi:MAG: oligosaccharide flippase family protein [Elusimicrobia bacterium]|nr:oligosaccharide flippase family protein [Elusimicrobiota bacterium]
MKELFPPLAGIPEPAPPLRHQVKVRFSAALLGTGLRLLVSLATGILVAKGLGPSRYGTMNFLLSIFAAMVPMLDMGSAAAFYTFISRRKRSRGFYGVYAGWLAAQVLILALISGFLPRSWLASLWLGQPQGLVFLALAAGFFANQIWRTLQQIAESARETILAQKLQLGISVVHLLLVLLGIKLDLLSVPFLFGIISIEYAGALLLFLLRFKWEFEPTDALRESFKMIWREYADFCLPMVVTSWIIFVYNFADRWLLQKYAGSVQQGFLSFGQQFSVITLIGATSLVNIFWKEIAHAHETKDHERMRRLFLKSTQALYFFAASIGCFLIPFSREILGVLVGPDYAGAWLTFAVMLFYPVHSNLGQINGSYLQATGKTWIYLLSAAFGVAISLPAAYFVVAPGSAWIPGLGLGAAGLAVKMVAAQIAIVNLQGLIICRETGWRWPMASQLMTPALLLLLAYSSHSLVALAGPIAGKLSLARHLGLAGAFFTLAAAALVWLRPQLAGLERDEMRRWIAGAISAVRT